MIRPRLRPRDYLQHIVSAIGWIESHTAGFDRAMFLNDVKTQDAVLRQLLIIGEAAQSLRQQHPDFIAAHPDAPWRSAYGMRNAVTHGYFTVDLERVWTTVESDLPGFAARIEAMLLPLDTDPTTGQPPPPG